MIIYVRHAEKAYKNGASNKYYLDPPLTVQGKYSSKNCFVELYYHYGTPALIVASPLLRTRQTASIAKLCTQYTGDILYESEISEHLNVKYRNTYLKQLRPDTLQYGVSEPESTLQFRDRVKCYANKMKIIQAELEPSQWILIVTHGWFIKTIADYNGENISYPSYLGMYIQPDTCTLLQYNLKHGR